METVLKIGSHVRKVRPRNDYTYGRTGKVEEISGVRVRVRWLLDKYGGPIITCGAKRGNGIRTWVNINNIILINSIYRIN